MNATTTVPELDPSEVYQSRVYLAQSLDPVHIGTGEFQLGRVDNPIVREAGTNLPKIPGSSLAGVARAYMAISTEDKRACAGKGNDAEEYGAVASGETESGGVAPETPRPKNHCAESTCPVCMSFGYSTHRKSFQGLIQFTDARVLFFPVYSLRGPMWITSPAALESAGVCYSDSSVNDLDAELRREHTILYCSDNTDRLPPGAIESRLNLGWLYLSRNTSVPSVSTPSEWRWLSGTLADQTLLKPVLSRIVVVDDGLFSIIVEDQLEVRTSVSINPRTGAAADGALFTSEAIPRSTFLQFRVTALNPAFFTNPHDRKSPALSRIELHGRTQRALSYVEYLGLGAATTRGMGRMRIVPAVCKPEAELTHETA